METACSNPYFFFKKNLYNPQYHMQTFKINIQKTSHKDNVQQHIYSSTKTSEKSLPASVYKFPYYYTKIEIIVSMARKKCKRPRKKLFEICFLHLQDSDFCSSVVTFTLCVTIKKKIISNFVTFRVCFV